jgi:hypothetical protein
MIVPFWNSLANWWQLLCPECEPISEIDVTLGSTHRNCHFLQINYILLAARWYISREKRGEQECFFMAFLIELKNKLEIMKSISVKNDKYPNFCEKWEEIYDAI